MKKIAIITSLLILSACSEMTSVATSNASSQTKIKACLTTEATSRYQAGTLFTSSVKETATEITKTCLQKLALESTGISQETQSTAETIVSNLQSLAGSRAN